MTPQEQLYERIGELADKADNFIAASIMNLSLNIHIAALRDGIRDIRDELKKIYIELTGDDPWAE